MFFVKYQNYFFVTFLLILLLHQKPIIINNTACANPIAYQYICGACDGGVSPSSLWNVACNAIISSDITNGQNVSELVLIPIIMENPDNAPMYAGGAALLRARNVLARRREMCAAASPLMILTSVGNMNIVNMNGAPHVLVL